MYLISSNKNRWLKKLDILLYIKGISNIKFNKINDQKKIIYSNIFFLSKNFNMYLISSNKNRWLRKLDILLYIKDISDIKCNIIYYQK